MALVLYNFNWPIPKIMTHSVKKYRIELASNPKKNPMNKYARTPTLILDLHGHTTREAKAVLDELLGKNEHSHIRIITGKGTYRETGPVLRSYVQGYLRDRDIAFEIAKISDGGDGALEVFLK